MTQRYFTHDEVVQALRNATHGRGALLRWCRAAGIDHKHASMCRNGTRAATPAIARALGFVPVPLYVQAEGATLPINARALRPLEQASVRAEIEAAKREQQKAERLAAGLNAIIARAAKVLERKPIHTRGRSAR